jgi:hypothetical protein
VTNSFTTPTEIRAAARLHEPGLPCWCNGFPGPLDIPVHLDDRIPPDGTIIAAPREYFEGWFRP